ncbi:S1 RNA-binding domain-containing protein [Schinkia azotoformans]|nr:S1 RNA-binding domain-containing protein [Schinkia azotoformans]MEC1640411.1 S1 RNA-binding domain-containing protein [Schinkia azotoformans]MEC1719311.1 S1 RNA-binding domain-containing protein [Schinkia azotoformans]MEC1946595.1 S1 RNA-binding domain-containing protein [Schinkia azotoformans]MED4353380.1 S1 RNA-binding domain-containing protein [Schinkia azotoformans]MED4413517.1 S1 RNA-binding domain-containing protein [Schinkia azotoformans]
MGNMMPGTITTLKVSHESPFGYFLESGEQEEDILLHHNEMTRDELREDEEVEVFLFQDRQGRLTATMTIPSITIHTFGWAKVEEVKRGMGVFVNIGIDKAMLLSKDDLPPLEEVWPQIDDEIYCTLEIGHNGRLFVRLAKEADFWDIAKSADKSLFNKNVTGRIYRTLYAGSFIFTEDGYLGFIHESERNEEPRIGEKVTGRVIDIKEDGTINVSLLPRKHEAMGDDAEKIYAYMETRNGAMPYWDKSQPEDIEARFGMSKGAFKRALGKLMKEGKVYQENGWTYFKKEQ